MVTWLCEAACCYESKYMSGKNMFRPALLEGVADSVTHISLAVVAAVLILIQPQSFDTTALVSKFLKILNSSLFLQE